MAFPVGMKDETTDASVTVQDVSVEVSLLAAKLVKLMGKLHDLKRRMELAESSPCLEHVNLSLQSLTTLAAQMWDVSFQIRKTTTEAEPGRVDLVPPAVRNKRTSDAIDTGEVGRDDCKVETKRRKNTPFRLRLRQILENCTWTDDVTMQISKSDVKEDHSDLVGCVDSIKKRMKRGGFRLLREDDSFMIWSHTDLCRDKVDEFLMRQ